MAETIGQYRKSKGFTTNHDNVPEKLMLIVTEISEACEAHRNNDMDNFAEELADAIIRILDLSDVLDIHIGREVEQKMVTNWSRPYKHGKEY